MSGGGEKGSATTKTPGDFLKAIRGRPVVVKLNSGVDYRGQFLFFSSIIQVDRVSWKWFFHSTGFIVPSRFGMEKPLR
jgi:hypothetical protein